MENTILLMLFLLAVCSFLALADITVAIKNWSSRKPASVRYWSAYERN